MTGLFNYRGSLLVSLSLALVGCLEGDYNPYAQSAGTGGNDSEGSILRSGTPAGTPIAPGTECSTNRTDVVSLTFNNTLPSTPLHLYWVGLSCEEVDYGALPIGGTLEVQTYAGHLFRLRSETTSELLFEYIPNADDPQVVTLP